MKQRKLKPEVKALWVAALEGGDFPQGRHALCNENGEYCCLGVLAELAVRNGVDVQITESNTGGKSYNGHAATLPRAVAEWAWKDFSDYTNSQWWSAGKFDPHKLSLVYLNDDMEQSFRQIAKFIREEL